MGQVARQLIEQLHGVSPYSGFAADSHPLDLQGGWEHPWEQELIQQVRPRIVVEVGSWKGASAIRMARQLKNLELDSAVICIDTWLGSLEHLKGFGGGWDIRGHLRHGYPQLYFQFLANVIQCGCDDLIIPVPNTSSTSAHWLAENGVVADLVYIDSSHEEEEVYRDLCLYWKLLRSDGVMFGDDWDVNWYGVICAVSRFAKERGLTLQIRDMKWALQKPA